MELDQKIENLVKPISEFFTDHTIGKLYKDLIFSLNKKKFETFIFHRIKRRMGIYKTSFRNL